MDWFWVFPFNLPWEESVTSHKHPCTLAQGKGMTRPYREPGTYQDRKCLSGKSLEAVKVLCHVPAVHAKVSRKLGQVSTAWQQNLNMLPEVLRCGVQGLKNPFIQVNIYD